MQTKPPGPPTEPSEELGQMNPDAMNSMMMQFAQMQNMFGGSPSSWTMSASDNASYPANLSPQPYSHNDQYLMPPQHSLPHTTSGAGFNMNQTHYPIAADRRSGGSNGVSEDEWSTRPRAHGHISKMDLMYIPAEAPKLPKAHANFDLNILKSVEGLLEDDLESEKSNSGFKNSNFLSTKKTQVRSVENSGFGATKNGSGWSDTTASKANKGRPSGNESVSTRDMKCTRSFGDSKCQEPKLNSELSTIFENKEGLFFSWHSSGQTDRRSEKHPESESHCEGFKLVSGPKQKRDPASTGVHHQPKDSEQKYFSNFYDQSSNQGGAQTDPKSSKHSKKDEYTSEQSSKY